MDLQRRTRPLRRVDFEDLQRRTAFRTYTVVIPRTSSSLRLYLYGNEAATPQACGWKTSAVPVRSDGATTRLASSAGRLPERPGCGPGGAQNRNDLLIYSLGVNESKQIASSGATITADIAAGVTSFTVSGYLLPRTYHIDNDAIRIRTVTGPSVPCTATTGAIGPVSQAYTNGATINPPAVRVDSWLFNGAQAFTDLGEANPTADILIVHRHVGQYKLNNHHHIAREARGVAEEFGAALIDMWAIGRNSSAYCEALG